MIIKLHQLSEKPFACEFQLQRQVLTRVDERLVFKEMRCYAELVKVGDSVKLTGSYGVDIDTTCDCCLVPVRLRISQPIELLLMDEEAYDEPERDVEVLLHEEDFEYYSGQEIALSSYFEDQLLLDLPLTIKCSDECRGLCPVCGVNRNQEVCHCLEEVETRPFAHLDRGNS